MSSQGFPNRFYSGLTITAESTSSSNVGQQRKGNKKEHDESPPVTPDSTTEPPPRPIKPYQEGEDVFFHTDNGQHILGTVGQIEGQTCQILFGDGTQHWASFKRIKKLSCALDDEDGGGGADTDKLLGRTDKLKRDPVPSQTKKVKSSQNKQLPRVSQTTELPCAICGILRRISQKKAMLLEGEGALMNLFKCRRCSNQRNSNMTSRNSREDSLVHAGPFIKPGLPKHAVSRQNRSVPSEANESSQGGASPHGLEVGQNSSAFGFDYGGAGKAIAQVGLKFNPQIPSIGTISTPHSPIQLQTESGVVCFQCEKETRWYNRIHCNLCERPCHLMCLPTTPAPLNGDRFWDLMCSSCGLQIERDQNNVYSVRRNISSWSDIVQLIISCLSVNSPGERFYDLDQEILPFLESQMDRLHLPRQYKVTPPEERKKHLEIALNNSRLRFINGKELGDKKSVTQWAIRNESYKKPNQSLQNVNHKTKQVLVHDLSVVNQKLTNSGELTGSVRKKRKYVRKDTTTKLKQSEKMTNSKPSKIKLKLKTNTATEFRNQVVSEFFPSRIVSKRACEEKSSLNTKLNEVNCDSTFKLKINNDSGEIDKYNDVAKVNTSRPSTSATRLESSSTSSSSSSSSSTTSSTNSLEENLPNKPGRGRPKGRTFKRSLSPSSPSQEKEPKLESIRIKKSLLQIRLPFYKKPKIDPSLPMKDKTPPPTPSTSRSTPSPLRPVLKVATVITPPKSTLSVSEVNVPFSSDEMSSSGEDDDRMGEIVNLQEFEKVENTDCIADLPRAVKTASVVPVPAPQIQVLLRKEPLKSKTGRPGRPKLNHTVGKHVAHGRGHLNTSAFKLPMLRLRPRGRGRPAGTKNHRSHMNSDSSTISVTSPLKPSLTFSTNGLTKMMPVVPHVQRRNHSAGMSDKNKAQTHEKLAESTNEYNSSLSDSVLFNAALYGGYRMNCLPPSPRTELETRQEAIKVFAHYRTEKEDEMATLLLGRSETETRSQSRRKSELFGMQKRDLNDFDSYDIMGKRVDPDGTTRYFIAWKLPGLEDESDSDDQSEEGGISSGSIASQSMKSVLDEDEEMPQYLMEVGRNSRNELTISSSPDTIDLTDSS